MSDDTRKLIDGLRLFAQGGRGIIHGYERLQRGAQIIAEAEPETGGAAMRLAANLAPLIESMRALVAQAEGVIAEPEKGGEGAP